MFGSAAGQSPSSLGRGTQTAAIIESAGRSETSAADGAFPAGGFGLGELPARVIAQDSVGQVDLLNRDLEASQTTAPTASSDPTCHTLATAADANNLPLEFLTRLIWQESRFDPQAVSPAGAQGVAQFMPKTAAWRGLADPFDPVQAITKSFPSGSGRLADYLRV